MAQHPQQAVSALVEAAVAARPFMVVITGGEPSMQDLIGLTRALHDAGLRVHVETSGSHPLSGKFDWITLSPKRFKPPLEEIYSRADELKVVIGDRADLSWAEAAAQKVSSKTSNCYSPSGSHQAESWSHQAENEDSASLVFEYVLLHPEWRMSLQTHKFLGVR